MMGLLTLPIRCALIILWKDAGEIYLLSTQILDGIGGGFFGLLHPYLVADITFGTGRFNVLSMYPFLLLLINALTDSALSFSLCYAVGLTASCFGLGATLSNLLGQIAVEKMGHVASLLGSLALSLIPICLFAVGMPETYGQRGKGHETSNAGYTGVV